MKITTDLKLSLMGFLEEGLDKFINSCDKYLNFGAPYIVI